MNDLKKAECISLERAQAELNIARGTLNSYMALLSVPRYKFPLDRRAYITLIDFERVKRAIDENR